MALKAVFAVYGALAGERAFPEARVVTNSLQQALDGAPPDGSVKISNSTMGGDAAPGHTKHFGAIVEVNGEQRPFACQENQTIKFNS
jgi:hypothetical protein